MTPFLAALDRKPVPARTSALAPTTAPAPAAENTTFQVLGDRLTALLTSRDTRGEFSLFLMENGPDGGVPRHVHDRESEAFHVLEGAYEVELCGRVRTLTPGMSAYLPAGQPHAWKVVGGQPARTLVLTTPGGLEHMFADLTALGFRGPFDLSDLSATTARHGVRMLPPAADLGHD